VTLGKELFCHGNRFTWSFVYRFETCSASDKEFAQLQENFERIVHLSARQIKHKRRWRTLVHLAIGWFFPATLFEDGV
jgi:hypothetical protein